MPSDFQPAPYPGILHHYLPRLTAFEHAPNPSREPPSHTLLWIGGLGDTPLSVPYPRRLAGALPHTWRLVEPHLASSRDAWGIASLPRDAADLAACVAYFRARHPAGRIALMGHSTGCQDILYYLSQPSAADARQRPPVDGAVLQAPVSDRESLVADLPPGAYDALTERARAWIAEGRGEDVLPRDLVRPFSSAPVTARRWLSLASPGKDGEDDFFSSDLEDARLRATFGRVGGSGASVLILCSGADEYVPQGVDVPGLVTRWKGFVEEGGGVVDGDSGIVEGATHNLKGNPDAVVDELIGRVCRYLATLEKESRL